MNNKPLVSILVPVYNVEKYIERCVRSLFGQTYENLEYIFVDDGSTDDSIAIIKKVVSEYPNRESHVHIFSFSENRGLPTARNFLVEHCETDWLIHVDADDWIEHDLVEELVKKQLETGADMVFSGLVYHKPEFDDSRRFLESDQKSDFMQCLFTDGAWVHIWGILIRRGLYTENNIRVPSARSHAEDLRVIYRLMYYAKRISGTKKDGYNYEWNNPNGLSIVNSHKVLERGLGVMSALEEVRSFVIQNMPEYTELYDKRIYMGLCNHFLELSFVYSNKELHCIASKHHRDVIHRYLSSYSCGFKDRVKREIKYHYWLAKPLLKYRGVTKNPSTSMR
jgi:glycosyltransferase involved in cell wall biosynthesis